MVESGLTVACVLWVGNFRRRNYSPEWVVRLRSMVARNLQTPHRFVCLSNVDVPGVEVIPLTGELPGWWSKIELFAHDLGDRTLYLDLDTLVVDDLTPIVEHDSRIAFMPPSYELRGGSGHGAGGVGVVDRYQTSCGVWSLGEGRHIWDEFDLALCTSVFRGDQDYIGRIAPHCDHLPADWFMKLRNCQDGPPEGVRVVLSMPWKCDVAAERFPWVLRTWM